MDSRKFLNSVSIIVPVFNAERYLAECVGSVKKLSSVDWELLLIDDGSTDSSASMCDDFACADNRIRVFHTKNHGVSAARNFGLGKACKTYIAFIDADDWIDAENFAESLSFCAQSECEILYTPYWRVLKGKSVEEKLNFGPNRILRKSEKDDLLQKRLAAGIRWMGSVWRTFFSRELISPLNFDSEIKFQEDVLFSLQALRKAKTVGIYNTAHYFYRLNDCSASSDISINTVEARMLFIKKMFEWGKTVSLDLSFARMRRMCPVYARRFAAIAKTNPIRLVRFRKLFALQKEIPRSDMRKWKVGYFGKSFVPYVLACRFFGGKIGFVFLCLRFLR